MDTNSIRQIVQYVWQIVTPALVIYVGFLLYRQIQALKGTVEAQKTTIEAQSTVLQDFERLNKVMKQVLDTVDAPAMLQRMRDYQTLVDIKAAAELEQQTRQQEQKSEFWGKLHTQTVSGFVGLIGEMLPFIPPDRRTALINSAALNRPYKATLQELAEAVPRSSELFLSGLVFRAGLAAFSSMSMGDPSGSLHPPDEEHPS